MNQADTAWMLVSTALVLLMTPALAFFYGGLVRSKNALNTMMMSFVALGFVGILWALSGSFAFSMGGSSYQIAGAMVWLAVAYCVVGTVITHFIGRPLIGTNFRQQRFEADFRHHLVRVREYSEAIALDKGEKVEHGQLDLRFGSVLRNYLVLIKQQKNLITFTSFFGQAAVIFPFLVAAPRFFSGAIQLGQLMQISSAFGKVQDSLSWFVDNYDRVAVWRATTDRLTSFDDAMRAHAARSQLLEERLVTQALEARELLARSQEGADGDHPLTHALGARLRARRMRRGG